MAFPYLVLAWRDVPFPEALAASLGSLVTIAGFAGFGYALNDWGDRKHDAAGFRPNSFASVRGVAVAGLAAAFALLATLPWVVVLPWPPHGGALLAVEALLLAAYALPPLRLKTRGAAGVVADAAYAHAVPALLAALTFAALPGSGEVPVTWLVCAALWQFAQGLRNIVAHQVRDHAADAAAAAGTLAVRLGPTRAGALLVRVLVPLEVVGFASFCLASWGAQPWLLPAYAVCVARTVRNHRSWFGGLWHPSLEGNLWAYHDQFYLHWLPLLALLPPAARDARFFALLGLHLVAFRPDLFAWRRAAAASHA